MSDQQTFGPRLRRERERRGITIETIAAATKVGGDLWEGLERNDFSRWPSGIFARAFVRDYARVLGLDPEELVDEFCRLFPVGDRRTDRVIKAQAELIGHEPAALLESEFLPAGGDRRAGAAHAPFDYLRLAPRAVSALVDAAAVLLLGATSALLFDMPFWGSVGVIAVLYQAASNFAGASPGSRAATELRQRVPSLFAVPARRRVHA
jgi:transcriptional regulator with XRE-family HTH domain